MATDCSGKKKGKHTQLLRSLHAETHCAGLRDFRQPRQNEDGLRQSKTYTQGVHSGCGSEGASETHHTSTGWRTLRHRACSEEDAPRLMQSRLLRPRRHENMFGTSKEIPHRTTTRHRIFVTLRICQWNLWAPRAKLQRSANFRTRRGNAFLL